MKKMFRDSELQNKFEQDGYVVVPFLDADMLKNILEFYATVRQEHEITSSVHSTSDTNNESLIRLVDSKLKFIIKEKIATLLFECRIFLSNFLIKEPDIESRISPHQDWTFVDEKQFASASIWCPLTDIDAQTGRISVIKGSHRFIETLRAPPDSPSAFEPVSSELDTYLLPLSIKAGDALIYNHALIHASEPNLSKLQRPVAVWAVVPEEAQLLLHYYHPAPAKRKLEKFEVDTDFFYQYAKNSRPYGKYSKGFIDYEFKQITTDDFFKMVGDKKIKPAQKQPQESLLMRIFRLFTA